MQYALYEGCPPILNEVNFRERKFLAMRRYTRTYMERATRQAAMTGYALIWAKYSKLTVILLYFLQKERVYGMIDQPNTPLEHTACFRCGKTSPEYEITLPDARHGSPETLVRTTACFCNDCAADIRKFAMTPIKRQESLLDWLVTNAPNAYEDMLKDFPHLKPIKE